MKAIITKNKKETIALGKKIAKSFMGGEVVALVGDLGAGKTTLIKGMAIGLGIKKIVISPTFLLMRVYSLKGKRVIKYFVHIDCYRLGSAQELKDVGADEFFGQKDAITVIEWPQKVKEILPKNVLKVRLEIKDDKTRKIILG